MSENGCFSERKPSSDRTSGATLFGSSSTASAARSPFGAMDTDSSESRPLGDRQGLQPIHRNVVELMQHWAEPRPNAPQARASAPAPMQAVKEFGNLGSASHWGGDQDSKLGQTAQSGQAGGALGSAHAGGDVVGRDGLRQADDRGLGRRVRGLPAVAALADDRRAGLGDVHEGHGAQG